MDADVIRLEVRPREAAPARLRPGYDLEAQLLARHAIRDTLAGCLAPLPDRIEEGRRPGCNRGHLVEDVELRRLRRQQLVPGVLVRLRQGYGGSVRLGALGLGGR